MSAKLVMHGKALNVHHALLQLHVSLVMLDILYQVETVLHAQTLVEIVLVQLLPALLVILDTY